jgi:hypothetical protein
MAKPTRRSVLRAGVVLAATAVPVGVAETALSVVAGGSASGLRRSTFKPHVGTVFRFRDGDRTYSGVLKKVGDSRSATRGHDKKFRLVFALDASVPQGTYSLRHPKVGTMDLFVSPIGQQPGVYEAVVDAG